MEERHSSDAHQSRQKKKECGARILEIEKGSFTPLIFSCNGGAGLEETTFIKRLAHKISTKRGSNYSETVNFIRRRICFDILRTCILLFRGERGPLRAGGVIADIDLDTQRIHIGDCRVFHGRGRYGGASRDAISADFGLFGPFYPLKGGYVVSVSYTHLTLPTIA